MMAAGSAAEQIEEQGRFCILGTVGRGTYSVVYRAYDRESRLEVALKVLLGWSSLEIYRLKREFRILRSLRHPSLVEIYELFSDSTRGTFFSMEFVDGRPLLPEQSGESDQPGREGNSPPTPPSYGEVFRAARELVDALLFVHAAGIVHRDVKPSNVLWRSAGGVVLLDFGLAAHRDPEGVDRLIERGPAGTWVYMAPEVILGRSPTPACDWYSLAVMLLEAITGLPAFVGTAAEVWQAKQKGLSGIREALGRRVPGPVADLLVAALNPEPARRPDGGCWRQVFSETELAGQTPSAVPIALQGSPSFVGGALVGREEELQELTALYKKAARGQTVVAVVAGPGGRGKSELVCQFLRQLALAESPLIFRGRCHWQECVPFNAFDGIVDELSLWLSAQEQNPLECLAALQRHCLARVFPVMASEEWRSGTALGTRNMQPREVRRVAFESLRELLAGVAERSQLVLWIDDAQWADADSAALLTSLFRPPGAPPALIIFCQRSDQLGTPLPVLGDSSLRSWPDVVRTIFLPPLPVAAARKVAALRSQDTELSPGLIEEIVKEADGSPLLIDQLVEHVGRCIGSGRPATSLALRDLLRARVETLPVAAQRMLDLVAVAVHPIARHLLLRMAGLGERGRPLVSLLDAAHLLHTTRVGEQVLVEPYHHRLGETLREGLPASEVERCHVLLAQHLATEATVEEERVFYHWRAAGRMLEAAEWALRAGDRAARQLAFEKAAELYAEALALGSEANVEGRVEIERKRAEMLVNAGRGAAAASVFLALARRTPDTSLAHDLERRAAEEYLMSGHVLEGTAALRSVLGFVGLKIPGSPLAAFLGSLLQVFPLWWRERHGRAVGAASLATAQARCDACHAAAKGFSFVDPLRGLYFSLHALGWALASSDRHRLARALSLVGSNLLPMGGFFGRWAARMIERAGAIARMTDDAYLEAVTALGIAQTRMMECRWTEMLSLCEHAREVLLLRCRGTTWEVSVATMAALRALEELGRLSELHKQAVAMVHEASRTGNLYAEVTGLLYEGFCLLAAGESRSARRLAIESSRRWKTPEFHVQHFYAGRLVSLCDLYEGRAAEAERQFEPCWRRMQRSGLMRHRIFRIDALLVRGRLAVAQMGAAHQVKARRQREVARLAKALEREGRADASGWSLVFRAAMAASAGEAGRSLELLTAAQQKFDSAAMSVAAAVAGYHAGQQCGGRLGDQFIRQAEELFANVGVAAPARFVNMLAPGFATGSADG